MEYIILKVTSTLSSARLYRTLAVNKNISLKDLGIAILASFNAEFVHNFIFKDKKYVYNPEEFDDLFYDNDVYMIDYNFQDIIFDSKDQFLLEYDTGENYDFIIKIDGKLNINSTKKAILLEGKGFGIFEDDIQTLYDYLHNNIIDETKHPWNMETNILISEFDNPIDIDKLNNKIENKLKQFYEL